MKGSHRFWVLNITAATLWCLLDGQANADDLALSYSKRFGLDTTAARKDVSTLLKQFGQRGLLNDDNKNDQSGDITAQRPAGAVAAGNFKRDSSGLKRLPIALAGHGFSLAINDKVMAEECRALFRHLAIGSELAGNFVELAVINGENGSARNLFCYENGHCNEDGLAENEVAPWLVYRLFDHGMTALTHRLLFHAAVVAKGGQALLLPANSGSGKSTLAAAMTSSGWTYLSDELAVVNPETMHVEPFAMPIGLKDKSVAPLAEFIPEIRELPRHIRADGVGVRYFTPSASASEGDWPIAALVFPHYGQTRPAVVTSAESLESLSALAETGSSARPLVSKDIAAILHLAALPGYFLQFSDLKAALGRINDLFA